MNKLSAWTLLALLPACSTRPNPDYCETNADCLVGYACNSTLHACEMVDASPPDIPSDGPFIARTVQEVRASTTAIDTPVELAEVVVVSVDEYGSRTGEFWVQQPGGGMASGLHVYGAVASEVAALQSGDVVSIAGARKISFVAAGDTTGRREIELAPRAGGAINITKSGATATPLVTMVDAAALAQLSQPARDAEHEKLAGMYVQISLVKAFGAPVVKNGEPLFLEFETSGFFVQTTHAPFPSGITQGTCFSSIRGVVEYFRAYNLVPARTSDVVVGSGCP